MKKTPPLTHKRYEQEFEYMFIFVKDKIKTFNPILIDKKYMDTRSNKAFGRNKTNEHDMGYSSKNTQRIDVYKRQDNKGKDQFLALTYFQRGHYMEPRLKTVFHDLGEDTEAVSYTHLVVP